MKYSIDKGVFLCIRDEFDNLIFIISKHNTWGKSEYDHKGKQIYFENSRGLNKIMYYDEI